MHTAHRPVVFKDCKRHLPLCSGWVTEFKELFAAYEAKQKQNVLDYDDLPGRR
jgi:hypothetical protein